jgi:hypothetical protein
VNKLLVISLDTYRKDNLGKVVDGIPISPFLTRIMKQGTFYSNYFASCNWTIPSYATMFTGKPTVEHNFWGYRRFPGQPTELIFDILAAAEIRPSLICCGVLAESDIFQYRTKRYFGTTYDMRKTDGMINLICNGLRQSEFVFFHTFLMHDYDQHYDYQPSQHGIKRQYLFLEKDRSVEMGTKMRQWRQDHFPLTNEDLGLVERMYYNECRMVDDFMATLFEVVLSQFPDVEIIVNSDHGECFSQCGKKAFDGNWNKTRHPLWHHSTGFCFEQYQAFAIEYNPRTNPAGTVNNSLMDHEDIYGMVMSKFGLRRHDLGSKTYNLISTSYDRVGFCGVLEDGDIHLYDRNNDFKFLLKDNLYTNDFTEPDPESIERYRRILRSRSLDMACYAEASDEVRARLQGFGYL